MLSFETIFDQKFLFQNSNTEFKNVGNLWIQNSRAEAAHSCVPAHNQPCARGVSDPWASLPYLSVAVRQHPKLRANPVFGEKRARRGNRFSRRANAFCSAKPSRLLLPRSPCQFPLFLLAKWGRKVCPSNDLKRRVEPSSNNRNFDICR